MPSSIVGGGIDRSPFDISNEVKENFHLDQLVLDIHRISNSSNSNSCDLDDNNNSMVVSSASPSGPRRSRVLYRDLFEDFGVRRNHKNLAEALKVAKRNGLITYSGGTLVKGRHDNIVISTVPPAIAPPRRTPAPRHGMDLRDSQISATSCVTMPPPPQTGPNGNKRASETTTTSTATRTTTNLSSSKNNLFDDDDDDGDFGGVGKLPPLSDKQEPSWRRNSLGEEEYSEDGHGILSDDDNGDTSSSSSSGNEIVMGDDQSVHTNNNDLHDYDDDNETSYFTKYPESVVTKDPSVHGRTTFADIQRRFFANGVTKPPPLKTRIDVKPEVSPQVKRVPQWEVVEVESVSSEEFGENYNREDASRSSYSTESYASDMDMDVGVVQTVEVESVSSSEEFVQEYDDANSVDIDRKPRRRSSYTTDDGKNEEDDHHIQAALAVARMTSPADSPDDESCITRSVDGDSVSSRGDVERDVLEEIAHGNKVKTFNRKQSNFSQSIEGAWSVSDYDPDNRLISEEKEEESFLTAEPDEPLVPLKMVEVQKVLGNTIANRVDSKVSASYASLSTLGASIRSEVRDRSPPRPTVKANSFHTTRRTPGIDSLRRSDDARISRTKITTYSSDLAKELEQIKLDLDNSDRIVESHRESLMKDQAILSDIDKILSKPHSFHGYTTGASRSFPRIDQANMSNNLTHSYGGANQEWNIKVNPFKQSAIPKSRSFHGYAPRAATQFVPIRKTQRASTGTIAGVSRPNNGVNQEMFKVSKLPSFHSHSSRTLKNLGTINRSQTSNTSTLTGSVNPYGGSNQEGNARADPVKQNSFRKSSEIGKQNSFHSMRRSRFDGLKTSARSSSRSSLHRNGSSFISTDQSEGLSMNSERLKMLNASLVSVDPSVGKSCHDWKESICISLNASPYCSRTSFTPNMTKSQVDEILHILQEESMENKCSKEEKLGFVGDLNEVGKRHGFGIYRSRNGTYYKGEWKDGKKDGFGIASYGASVYLGNWKNNKRHGHGVMKIENGDVFEGDWNDHVKRGVGAYHYYDGEVDISLYENDKRTGRSLRWSKCRQKIYELNAQNQAGRRITIGEAIDILSEIGIDVMM